MANYETHPQFDSHVKAAVRTDLIGYAQSVQALIANSALKALADKVKADYTDAADLAAKWNIPLAKAQAFWDFHTAMVTAHSACSSFLGVF